VIVEGRMAAMPQALLALLKDGGRAIGVVGEQDVSRCVIWTASNGHIGKRAAFDLSIPALPGFDIERPAFVF
jgi:protein-L-isoaspartate(D-aspartate) O-methyltransferase